MVIVIPGLLVTITKFNFSENWRPLRMDTQVYGPNAEKIVGQNFKLRSLFCHSVERVYVSFSWSKKVE